MEIKTAMVIQLDLNSSRLFRGLKSLKRLPELVTCFQQIENWSELIERYLSISSEMYPFSIKTRNGLALNIKDFYDVTTTWVIFCKQEYKVSSKHRVIVDLGANIGVFALFAARQSQKSKIICFEPFPETFQRLEDNVKNNRLNDRVVCHQLAVSGRREHRVMAPGGFGSTTSHLLESSIDKSKKLDADAVECITFGDMLKKVGEVCSTQTIDLLKMDIEGAEYEFLENISPDLLSVVNEVQMEYHPCGNKELLFNKLESAGLECSMDWIFGENFGVAHFIRNT
jgi:FkbM family methyltransferase